MFKMFKMCSEIRTFMLQKPGANSFPYIMASAGLNKFPDILCLILRFTLISSVYAGCPTSIQTASMGLNYDLGDKSENLRRMNHFEKFNKANRIFFLQKVLDFSSIMCVFWR